MIVRQQSRKFNSTVSLGSTSKEFSLETHSEANLTITIHIALIRYTLTDILDPVRCLQLARPSFYR